MSETPDNLVLARLREIRDMLGRVLEDTADLRLRVGALEAHSPRCHCEWTGWTDGWSASSAGLASSTSRHIRQAGKTDNAHVTN